MSDVLSILIVLGITTLGVVFILWPRALQQSALKMNRPLERVPVLGWIGVEWVRRPDYVVFLRVLGVTLLMVAGLLTYSAIAGP